MSTNSRLFSEYVSFETASGRPRVPLTGPNLTSEGCHFLIFSGIIECLPDFLARFLDGELESKFHARFLPFPWMYETFQRFCALTPPVR